jgi:prepilin-type N-terminal cleavage/methylation domain-containing protein
MNNKGFTLMEVLIVVAIIAVLVAIAIPVMSSQLEKSREAVDAANIRSAYAEVSVAFLTGDDANLSKTVDLKQKTDGWQHPEISNDIFPQGTVVENLPKAGKTCTVVADSSTGVVTITFIQS